MNSWNYLYKIDYHDFTLCKTNLLYTPTVNSDGSVMCIDYSHDPIYQKNNSSIGNELLEFFFEKEVRYIKQFQGNSWAPKLIDIQGTKIYIEFNVESLNNILLSNRKLDKELPNWKEQLLDIMLDIDALGYYKLALYPHSFFIGKDGNLKVLDFYTFVEKSNPMVPYEFIKGMVGNMSRHRFEEAMLGNYIDFSVFFDEALRTHLSDYWKESNPFPDILKVIKAKN